ncbi:MAG: PAS domain S-box protein [Rhodocyclaceae bacterium]|nr:PAS domain S-box protein [Rhodocyclaceae bacterium]
MSRRSDIPDPQAEADARIREKAARALREGDYSLAEDLLRTGEASFADLIENLRIYQVELEIQNDELRNAQRAAQISLEAFSALFSAVPLAQVVVDRTGLVLDANDEATRLFGLANRHLHQHYLRRLVADRDHPALAAALVQAHEKGRATATSLHFRGREKESFPGELHVAALPAPEGEIRRFVCAIVDLTRAQELESARRDTAEALRNREEVHRAMVEAAADGMVLIDPESLRFVEFNRAAHERLGYTAGEFARLGLNDIQGSLSPAEVARRIERMCREGGGVFENQHRAKDGSMREVHVANRVARVGERDYFAAIWSDITHRKRLEAILASTSEFVSRQGGGEAFYAALVAFAGTNLGADYAHVALLEPDPAKVRTIAAWRDGAALPGGHVYALAGTPCAHVLEGASVCIEADVCALYPDDADLTALEAQAYVGEGVADGEGRIVGLVVLVYRHGREFLDTAQAGLRILAARAGLEHERQGAEAALRESEARYRRIIETASEGFWSMDADHATTGVNQRMAQMLGYGPSEMIGLKVESFMYPEDLESHRARMRERHGGAGGHYERRFRRKDGSELWALVSATPVMDPGGRFAGSFAMFTDITERRRAEAELAATQQRLQMAVDGGGLGIYDIDLKTGRVSVNDRFVTMLGYRSGELETTLQGWIDSMHPEDRPLFLAAQQRAQRDGGELDAEYRIRRRDGQWIWVHQRGRAVAFDADGEALRAAGTLLDVSERRQAEESLRETTLFLREGEEIAGIGGWKANPETGYLMWTEGIFRLIGRPLDRAVPPLEQGLGYYAPEYVPQIADALDRAWRDGRGFVLEVEVVAYGGRRFWAELRCVGRLETADGPVLAGALQDIDARRRTGEQLRLLSQAVEQSPTIVIVTAPDTRIEYVNEAFCRISGYRPEEVIGRRAGFLGERDTPPAALRGLYEAVAGGRTWQGEFHNRRKDGRLGIDFAHVSPVREPDGRINHFLSVQEDITERKRIAEELERHRHHLEDLVRERTAELEAANRRLRLSDTRLQAMFAMSQQAADLDESQILQLGIDEAVRLTESEIGYLHFVNDDQETLHLVTWSAGTLKYCNAAHDEHYPISLAGIWADTARSRRPAIHNDYLALPERQGYPEGHAHLVRHLGVPVVEGDRVRMLVGVGNKATDYDDSDLHQLQLIADDLWRIVIRRRAEVALAAAKEAAEEASRAKSTFLANMSHEIRTPMNAIIGLAHLAQRSAEDPGQRDRLRKVSDAARHLLQVINDILDISKIEAGKLTLEETDFAPATVVERTVTLLEDRAREKGLGLASEIDPALPAALRGDAMRLGQILLNFGSNAVKFTERGDVVFAVRQVTRQEAAVTVRFAVRDSGPGIDEETRQRLFQPFEQADSSTTRHFGGTGLGLAISRRLADLMGGRVGVDSEPGRGSSFWFEATFRPGEALPPGEVAAAPSDAAEGRLKREHGGARVLLVEDNEINREVATDLLRDAGLTVVEAEDGARAVEMAAAGAFDLILMDVQMPVLDGLAATRAIRRQPGGEGVPILAMTANAFEDDRQACIDAGMNDHVPKPIDPTVLYAALIRWLPGRPELPPAGPAAAGPQDLRQILAGIRGLDLKAGLAAVRGRVASLARLLRTFAETHAGDMDELRRLLAAGARQEGRRLAHTLKGASGTLGLSTVQRAAAALEAALRDPGVASVPETMLAALEMALAEAVADIRNVLGVPAGKP